MSYPAIVVLLVLIAAALWLILAALVGITPRSAALLFAGAVWRFLLFAVIAGLIIYSFPALLDRLAYLGRVFF